jgi:hypothetical protein
MGRRLIQAFLPELEKIKNKELCELIKKIILDCCDYCCDIGASTSGKYHPLTDLGPGGLIRHTKIVCRNVETILKMWPQYDGLDWDYPYCSAILHDLCKVTNYNQEHSHQNHPLLIAEKIRKFKPITQEGWFIDWKELAMGLERIAKNCETHMSRWDTDKDGNKIGEKPNSMENAILAIADMLSAQKWFNAYFDENNNLIYYQNKDWIIKEIK